MTYFPDIVDHTIRSAFLRCPQRARYEFVDNLLPAHAETAPHASACFRKGLAATRKAYFIDDAGSRASIKRGVDAITESWPIRLEAQDHVPLHELHESLRSYFGCWPLRFDGLHPAIFESRPVIDELVLIKLPLAHPITFKPLMYAVHIDMVAIEQETGAMLVIDDRISDDPGDGRRYDLSASVTEKFYAASKLMMSSPIQGEVRKVSSRKTGMRVVTFRPQWMIDHWYAQVVADFGRMLKAYQRGTFDMNLDATCHEGGKLCGYHPLCVAGKQAGQQGGFTRVIWMPKTGEREKL